jgi:ankyrin repeat protein
LCRFLLAQLHLDSLEDKTTRKAITQALERLPKGLDVLDLAYKDAMERVKSQKAGFRQLAMQVLSWIACTKRPLKTQELQHALAVEPGKSELDRDNIPEIEDMVSVCAGLVTVDEESDIIRLVHYTVQEYFERTQISWFPDAQKDITTTCVTYLSFDAFEIGLCPTNHEFEARLRLNPLYDYAARNWGHHARESPMQVGQLILDFLESKAKVAGSSQAMTASKSYSYDHGYSQTVPRQMVGIHLAAYFGLREATVALLDNRYEPNLKDDYDRTALSLAAENGHEAVVKMLLAKDGIDPDSKDKCGQTPLRWAVNSGHGVVITLLLAEDGVNPNSKDNYGQTPLSWAAENGHEAVAKLLLAEDGVDPDSKDKYGQTPLRWAVNGKHEAVIKLLLTKDGVNSDSKDNYGQTPLSWAAFSGHEAVVKLLLAEDGVDPDSKNIYGRTPLLLAETMGHGAVAKLLLATGKVDPDFKDNENHPLQDYQMQLMLLEQQNKRRLCEALVEQCWHDRDLNSRIRRREGGRVHFQQELSLLESSQKCSRMRVKRNTSRSSPTQTSFSQVWMPPPAPVRRTI